MDSYIEQNTESLVNRYNTLIIVGVLLFCVLVGYWYFKSEQCSQPLVYGIGVVDEGFQISDDQILLALFRAEEVWEEPTFLNLFKHGKNPDIVVNFRFDDRQQSTVREQESKQRLKEVEKNIIVEQKEYDSLQRKLSNIQQQYYFARKQYEAKLDRYLLDKEYYDGSTNQAESFNTRKSSLENEAVGVEELRVEVNSLVSKINNLAGEGEATVHKYNEEAQQYNDQYVGSHQYDQGDYTSNGEINVYQYDSLDDLTLLMAHEFGHALGVEHVTDPRAIMYYQLVEQDTRDIQLQDADISGLAKECSLVRGL